MTSLSDMRGFFNYFLKLLHQKTICPSKSLPMHMYIIIIHLIINRSLVLGVRSTTFEVIQIFRYSFVLKVSSSKFSIWESVSFKDPPVNLLLVKSTPKRINRKIKVKSPSSDEL